MKMIHQPNQEGFSQEPIDISTKQWKWSQDSPTATIEEHDDEQNPIEPEEDDQRQDFPARDIPEPLRVDREDESEDFRPEEAGEDDSDRVEEDGAGLLEVPDTGTRTREVEEITTEEIAAEPVVPMTILPDEDEKPEDWEEPKREPPVEIPDEDDTLKRADPSTTEFEEKPGFSAD